VSDAALNLFSYRPRNQGCLDFRNPNLVDINPDLATGDPSTLSQLIDPLTAAADNDAGARGVDADSHLVCVSFDFNTSDPCVRQTFGNGLPDRQILVELFGVVAIGKPLATPVVDVTEAEAVRVYLLSH
jgi:hypothetical protein